MNRLTQNLMYVVIFLIIFAGSVFYFTHHTIYSVKGVYLSRYNVSIPPTNPKDVRVYNLHYTNESDGSIGTIRTSIHVDNEKDYNELCEKNIHKAIEIAAKNGVHEIKYICIYPEGDLNQLSSVSLLAYAFRD